MVLIAVGGLVWNFSTKYQAAAKSLSFSEFMASVDAGQVERVTITGNDITGVNKTNESMRAEADFLPTACSKSPRSLIRQPPTDGVSAS